MHCHTITVQEPECPKPRLELGAAAPGLSPSTSAAAGGGLRLDVTKPRRDGLTKELLALTDKSIVS